MKYLCKAIILGFVLLTGCAAAPDPCPDGTDSGIGGTGARCNISDKPENKPTEGED